MNKWQAVHSFWARFGVSAYDEATVPSKFTPEYPYITYSVAVGALDDVMVQSASIWDRSMSWQRISDMADEISVYIGEHVVIPIDGGYVKINKSTPFAQRMRDEDDAIRRILLNIQIEFLTQD